MTAQIIAFPGAEPECEAPEVPGPVDFDDWFLGTAADWIADSQALDNWPTEPEFWAQARDLRDRINAWPIPEVSGG